MTFDKKLEEKAEKLILKGQSMKATYKVGHISGPPSHGREDFNEWKSQSLAFLASVLGLEHVYSKQFEKEVVHETEYSSSAGIGILKAVRQDIQDGSLTELRTLISAEVFTHFLDMAGHLIDQKYFHPAASLVGAVLEDGLRTMARKQNIKLQTGDDLGTLNGKCSNAKVYNSILSKQIGVWTAIRNKADHGQFNEIKGQDVIDMHSGVTRFLAEQLK